jgi:2-keto-4-pentenoate hydratase/2-oxohepta-3-ene-1,7-dioic acid hydratase in catechol pathway
MKLVTFTHPETAATARAGILHGQSVVDPLAALYAGYGGGAEAAQRAAAEAPRDMIALLVAGAHTSGTLQRALELAGRAAQAGDPLLGPAGEAAVLEAASVRLLAPVPRPSRIRDYLTYEAHATGAGLKLPPAFDEMPACYECNTNTVIGTEEEILWPAYSDQLDYELEVGFFVTGPGRNLSVAEAAGAIGGVTIFNDVSARDIQLREMSMGIGPSKGKDFCNPMGPCITTMDEIDEWNIELTAKVNGDTWSKGTTASRKYSFAEVLAWASYCCDIQPGEFLAVGTVGGGCGFELGRWIQPGDVVELSSPQIGTLRNRVGSPEQAPPGAGIPSYHGSPRVPSGPH